MSDDEDIEVADFVPGAGERRVDQVLDELYNFNRLMSILLGVSVGGFVTTAFGLLAPAKIWMLALWLMMIGGLTVISFYRYRLN
jgi:pimeloyl-ACP methyl ester carboxylesterase